MLYAVMSDVHANPWALEKALADARAQGAERFYCLGDVVGYGPDAVGAVRLARENFELTLMGNHDAATVGIISSWNFRPEAKAGVYRHGLELGRDELTWLKGLPYTHGTAADGFMCAHGTPVRPENFDYIMREGDALAAFDAMGEVPLLFVGHTHKSLAVARTGRRRVRVFEGDGLELREGVPYIVNVGSVGYPRNEDESVYALYDSVRRVVVWRRLPFDYADYVARMKARQIRLPDWLEEVLAERNGNRGE